MRSHHALSFVWRFKLFLHSPVFVVSQWRYVCEVFSSRWRTASPFGWQQSSLWDHPVLQMKESMINYWSNFISWSVVSVSPWALGFKNFCPCRCSLKFCSAFFALGQVFAMGSKAIRVQKNCGIFLFLYYERGLGDLTKDKRYEDRPLGWLADLPQASFTCCKQQLFATDFWSCNALPTGMCLADMRSLVLKKAGFHSKWLRSATCRYLVCAAGLLILPLVLLINHAGFHLFPITQFHQ